MQTAKWWLYWIAWQLLSAIYGLLGIGVLLPPSLLKLWHERPGESWMFPGITVKAWDPPAIALSTLLAIVTVGLYLPKWASIPLTVLLILGAAFGVWDNEEQGVLPDANNGNPWLPGKPDWLRAYVWSAFRNAANGMRWLPGAAFLIDANGAKITRTPGGGYYAVANGRPCKCWKSFRIGWLINLDAAPGWRSWPIAGNTKGVPTS